VKKLTLAAVVAAVGVAAIAVGCSRAQHGESEARVDSTPASARSAGRPGTTGAPTVPIDRARTICISATTPIPNWTTPAPDCIVSWSVLGTVESRTLYAGRYSWPSDAGAPPSQQRYKIVTVVMYEGRGDDTAVTPIWNSQLDETDASFGSVTLQHAGAIPIVKVETCLNGTGGCGTTLYRWTPGTLVDIGVDLASEVRRALPADSSLNKAPQIDLASMKVVAGVWAEDDPNCCPSRTVTCTLRLDADKATVADCRLARTESK
jgi:hypothetical protein